MGDESFYAYIQEINLLIIYPVNVVLAYWHAKVRSNEHQKLLVNLIVEFEMANNL